MKNILLLSALGISSLFYAQMQDRKAADDCFNKGDFRCAESEYLKLAEKEKIGKIRGQFYNALGTSQKRLGKTSEAQKSYENAIKFSPDSAEGYVNLSNLHRQKKDLQKALQLVERGLLINYDNADLFLARAKVYEDLKKIDLAEKDYQQILGADPENFMAKTQYAVFKKDQGKLDAALKDYNQLIAEKPESLLYNNRADVFLAMKKYKEAQADIDKAIKLDPKFGMSYVTKAKILFETGRAKDACTNLDKALANGIDRFIVSELTQKCSGK